MKQIGKIELSNGSLSPNKRGLWYSAIEKLQEAQIGIEQMKEAQDRISYETGWIRFIDSLEEAWTSFFDEGKEMFSNFQPWVGTIVKKRKSDPLLSYIYQARHQSQHGRISIEWEEETIHIAPIYYGHIRDLKIFSDGSFEVEANPLGGCPRMQKIISTPLYMVLFLYENTIYSGHFSKSSILGQPPR